MEKRVRFLRAAHANGTPQTPARSPEKQTQALSSRRPSDRLPFFTGICLAVLVILTALVTANANAQPALSPSDAAQKGRTFLTNLFDPALSLLPEYRGAKVYWLFHDNYLAAKVLAVSHPKIAQSIRAAMDREGVRKSGKIELIFGEAENPLPFRQYELTDVRRFQDKVIRTEVVTNRVLEGWTEYADLLLLASIAEKDAAAARRHWKAALRLWDGKGFLDAAAKHDRRYSTYKLGLVLLVANRLSPPAKLPPGMIDKLLSLQDDTGGWITDYDAADKKIGLANVETTCFANLGD